MNKYEDTLMAKLIDETWTCHRGGVSYHDRLLAQALLKINVEFGFGFILIVSKLLLPLNLSQSYLTFYNKGDATGALTLEAVAKVSYPKGDVIHNMPVVNMSTSPELGLVPTKRDLGTLGSSYPEYSSSSAVSAHDRSLEKRTTVWGSV